jgi:hypothetical protein
VAHGQIKQPIKTVSALDSLWISRLFGLLVVIQNGPKNNLPTNQALQVK